MFGKGTEAFAVHQDLEFVVQRGEMLSLVGGSGTGKTVLLRQILGWPSPRAAPSPCWAARHLKWGAKGCQPRGHAVPARRVVSAFNVLDNVAFALREQGTLPEELVRAAALVKLQMVGLKPEHATRMPADLSGGMVKRVALARALIMDPPCCCSTSPLRGWTPAAPTTSVPWCASCALPWGSPSSWSRTTWTPCLP